MTGYDPHFLGSAIHLPLPSFSASLKNDVLTNLELREGLYADYIHFTIITNRTRRSPILAALNINQNLLKEVKRTDQWKIDSRIGADFQLDNAYYARNHWDRGHLARRASAAWGKTEQDAKQASDDTFFFSNAALQHENFNQDEWLALEDWVKNLMLDDDGRIIEFSGPVYGDVNRVIKPPKRESAEIPAAFFKVVCFVNKQTQKLDVRSFLMFQDREALTDNQGKQSFNFQRYQVTISEIQALTGLVFDQQIYEQNPLLFKENEAAREKLNVQEFPERIEVDEPEEMIAKDDLRDIVADYEVPVYLAAAMVNPKGKERENEWVSIINLSNEVVDLTGWTLSDAKRKPLDLGQVLPVDDRRLEPGQAVRVQPLEPLSLSNNGGVITLYEKPTSSTSKGRRVDRVHYTKQQASIEGIPIIFAYRQE